MIIRIQGKMVDFGVDQINDIYGLLNANINEFKEKGCEPESWLADRLCLEKEVSSMATKRNISMKDFTVEAWIWLNIIYIRVSPCTHIAIVIYLRAWMVA